MAQDNESTMKWKVDITQLKSAMQDAKRSISLANAEFKTATAGMDKWQNSTTGLEAKIKQLNQTLPQQKTILSQLKEQYKLVAENQGENSAEAQRLKIQIENQKAAIAKTETSIGTYNTKLKEMQAAESSLTNTISKQESELSSLKTAYVDAVAQYGRNSSEAKNLANQISSLSGELAENKAKQAEASAAADKLDKSLDGVGDSADEAADDVKDLDSGFTVLKGTMANLAAQAVTGLLNGFRQLGSAMISMGKQAIMSYADYEQLVGGVETLFGAGGKTIEEYAESVGKTVDEVRDEYDNLMAAQTEVLQNASNAYKTAGLSQNDYIETVTSFSASLIQSLGNDTAAAAAYADRAIVDMSDNANKMGTDMASIMNAYQGFAKGNYTMLDNLKLGYGGTQSEMQRLIADASRLTDVQEELGITVDANSMSFDNVVNAISVMQAQMGIAGTTSAEAMSTISGSLNMVQAAWSNMLTGMADDNADFDQLIDNFVESALAFGGNIIPRIKTTIQGMGRMISGLMEELVPQLIAEIPPLIEDCVPMLLSAIGSVVQTLLSSLPSMIRSFTSIIPSIVSSIVSAAPQMVHAGMLIIRSLIAAITSTAPELIAAIPELISRILDTFISNLPMILNAGLYMIQALLEGIMTALPELLDYIPVLIQSICDFINENLPSILETGVQLLLQLAMGILNAIPSLIAMLPTIIQTIVGVLMHNLPVILNAGVQLLLGLIMGLVNAIPQLVAMLPTIITTIVTVLTENLPMIIQMGMTTLVSLIQGLTDALPQLISMLPQITQTVIDVLTDNLPLILQMGVEILFELIAGLGNALPDLGLMMVEIGAAILDSLAEVVSQMFDIGSNIVSGIWEGISNGYDWIVNKISGWVDNVVDFIMDAFGVASPSKVMRDMVGRWLPEGIAVGFEADMPSALKSMKKSMNGALSDLKADVALQTDNMFGGVGVNGSGSSEGARQQIVNFNQTINSPKAVDGMTLYRQTNSLLFSAEVRLGNV